ncbi:MAG: hypothetical protein H6Q75_678 [Firmicutes bacterium]|nr:hypothetical protein [Bacillota bacterium]
MRKIIMPQNLVLIVLLLAAFVVLQFPVRPQNWIYPLVRYVTQLKLNLATRSMSVYETEHFIIKYEQGDADVIAIIGQAAEKAYRPVTAELNFTPQGKTLLLVYPDKQQLNQLFGWSGSQSAMGVYWGGVIQILSPKVWLKDVTAEEFVRTGPMVHEFTHLVFDYMTSGNYPRWFTEGLAQYVEYKVNGYEWRTEDNSISRKLYTMAELDDHFDELNNQALAYRESLMAVRYIAAVHGEDKLHALIDALRRGTTFKSGVETTLGMEYSSFETQWQVWARENE